MKTYETQLLGTPQFDSGRWKLRLERMPVSTDRQFTKPVISNIALGFAILSPPIFLIATYLWARVSG